MTFDFVMPVILARRKLGVTPMLSTRFARIFGVAYE
jgi:hypothetical protein